MSKAEEKSKAVSIENIVELPKFEKIEGPFINEFNGKRFYNGYMTIDGVKLRIAFDLKYVEYGKVKVKPE